MTCAIVQVIDNIIINTGRIIKTMVVAFPVDEGEYYDCSYDEKVLPVFSLLLFHPVWV